MLTAYNPRIHALVVICPAAVEYPVAEHEAFLAAVRKLDQDGVADGSDIAMMVVLDPKSPPPTASWRQRYGEQRAACKSRHVYSSVVTESALLRGVLTALNWVKQPPPHIITATHKSVTESMTWIETMRGESVPELAALYGRARGMLTSARARVG